MRILVLSNFYPPHFIGGYELGCREVVEGLRLRGHEPLVLTSMYGVTSEGTSEADVLRRFHLGRTPGGPRRNLQAVGAHNLTEFRKALSTFQPDIVYAWNMEHLGNLLLLEIETHSLPHAYYVSDLWMTRAAGRGLRWLGRKPKRAIWRRAKRMLAPLVSQAFSLSGEQNSGTFQNLQFCSRFISNKITSLGAAAGACEVIYWGVQPEKFVSLVAERKHPTRLIYVGQIEPHKGVHTAVRAFSIIQKEIPDARLTLVGGTAHPAYLDKLRGLAGARTAAAISFTGKVASPDVRNLYRAHDILLFPSEWDEPFAMTPLEAMAAGLAVVATSTGGSAEIFENGVNSLIYEAGNYKDCARQTVHLLKEPELLRRIARAGRNHVREKFTLDTMLNRIEEHFRRVMQVKQNSTRLSSRGAL